MPVERVETPSLASPKRKGVAVEVGPVLITVPLILTLAFIGRLIFQWDQNRTYARVRQQELEREKAQQQRLKDHQ